MDSRVGVDEVANLSNLESEGGILEWLLHLSWTEVAKITSIFTRSAL